MLWLFCKKMNPQLSHSGLKDVLDLKSIFNNMSLNDHVSQLHPTGFVQIMWKVRSRDLIFLPPFSITGRHFYAPRPHPLRPFPCQSKRDTNCVALPASPVSRAGRYNTLHLASKVMCQRGPVSPFWKPPVLPVCWP